ncbi:MAG: DedA family protein [Alphaproteobacteria bacterium]|nr:DedA family protein [Alphaproteobacteria bacterium]
MLIFLQNIIRKTYDLMLKWSASPNAMFWLFLVAFAESSFFPIPPDIMLIPMILATPTKAWKIAGVATLASLIGGYFGYAIGVFAFDMIAEPILNFYHALDKFHTFENYYHQYGAWIVFGAGITPFPYKIITIASGVVHLDLIVFTIASILARGMRFFVVAWLLKKYGEPMKYFIDKHLGKLSVLFLILLIAGFAAVKLF